MLWFALWPIVFCGVLTFTFSALAGHFVWQVPAFFFAQSFFAFTLLELVNYVEHYGIMRREITPGNMSALIRFIRGMRAT